MHTMSNQTPPTLSNYWLKSGWHLSSTEDTSGKIAVAILKDQVQPRELSFNIRHYDIDVLRYIILWTHRCYMIYLQYDRIAVCQKKLSFDRSILP